MYLLRVQNIFIRQEISSWMIKIISREGQQLLNIEGETIK